MSFWKVLENSRKTRVMNSVFSQNTNLQLKKPLLVMWACCFWKKFSSSGPELFRKKAVLEIFASKAPPKGFLVKFQIYGLHRWYFL